MMSINRFFSVSQSLFVLILFHCTPTNTKIIKITDEPEFNKLVRGKNKQVIVKFSANWCGACTEVKKPFEEVSSELEFDNIITFVYIDVDQVPTLSKKYQIVDLPTFIYLENGKQKEQDIGVQDIRVFKNHLRNKLRKNFILSKLNPVPGVALLPQDYSLIQKEEQAKSTGIIAYIKNTTISIVTSIKEWFVCSLPAT